MINSGFIYVLRCGDGTYYTGKTTDPITRLVAHYNGTGSYYTRDRLPVQIVFIKKTCDMKSNERDYRRLVARIGSDIENHPESLPISRFHSHILTLKPYSKLNIEDGFDASQNATKTVSKK